MRTLVEQPLTFALFLSIATILIVFTTDLTGARMVADHMISLQTVDSLDGAL